MFAHGEPRLEESGEGTPVNLDEPSSLGLGEAPVRPVGVGLAPPQVEGGGEVPGRRAGVVRDEFRMTASGEVTDEQGIHRRARQRECVSRTATRHELAARALGTVRLERTAQSHDVRLERLAGRGRWCAVPQRVDQPIGADHTRSTRHQDGEEQALLRTRHGDGCQFLVQNLQRPEDRDAHATNGRGERGHAQPPPARSTAATTGPQPRTTRTATGPA